MLRPAGLRFLELALAGSIALAAVRPAAAEDATVTQADALFEEAVKLRESNPELACAKFNESMRLNPQAIGVLLNVAMCDERQGRLASAVRRYRETRERAVELNFPEYRKAADDRLAVLADEVPRLTIRFEKTPPPLTKVVVDDQLVALSALEELPLDPGERIVVISAPGRIPFQRKISLARRDRRELAVPALQKPSSRRTLGKITLAAGGAALVTGVVLGLVARDHYGDARHLTDAEGADLCTKRDGRVVCEGEAYADIQSARQLGNVGTIVGGAGIAAMLAGGYLWMFTPEPHGERAGPEVKPLGSAAPARRGVSVVPRVGPDGAGVTLLGRF
jgi:hypothetical protein